MGPPRRSKEHRESITLALRTDSFLKASSNERWIFFFFFSLETYNVPAKGKKLAWGRGRKKRMEGTPGRRLGEWWSELVGGRFGGNAEGAWPERRGPS